MPKYIICPSCKKKITKSDSCPICGYEFVKNFIRGKIMLSSDDRSFMDRFADEKGVHFAAPMKSDNTPDYSRKRQLQKFVPGGIRK